MWKTILAAFLLFGGTAIAQEIGLASYYSDKYNGGRTASGETYNRNEMVAAHKSLPYDTRIRVTRLDDNRSVVVRIIDRMPDVKGRVVDLSGRAAEQLGMLDEGTTQVRLDVLSGDAPATTRTEPRPAPRTTPPPRTSTPRPRPAQADDDRVTVSVPEPDPGERTTVVIEEPAAPRTNPTPNPPRVTTTTTKAPAPPRSTTSSEAGKTEATPQARKAKTFQPYDLYQIQLLVPEKTGFGVQVANLSSYENALKKVADLQAQFFDNILLSISPGKMEGTKSFRIILGPFESQKQANAYKRSLKKKKIEGFVVPLSEF